MSVDEQKPGAIDEEGRFGLAERDIRQFHGALVEHVLRSPRLKISI